MLRVKIEAGRIKAEQLELIAGILKRGGVGVIPTDTVYGLAALATSETGVSRLYEIKGRPPGKPLPVQIAEMKDARSLAIEDRPGALNLMSEFWPGPLTLVMERRSRIQLPFQRSDSVGLRIPDHPFCLELIRNAGYLVVPSANLSGEPPPASLQEVNPRILGSVDFSVDGGSCSLGVESAVVDFTAGLKIIREGAIGAGRIELVAGRAG